MAQLQLTIQFSRNWESNDYANESTLRNFNYFYQCSISQPPKKAWKWAFFNPQETHYTSIFNFCQLPFFYQSLLKHWFRHIDPSASSYLMCNASFSVLSITSQTEAKFETPSRKDTTLCHCFQFAFWWLALLLRKKTLLAETLNLNK